MQSVAAAKPTVTDVGAALNKDNISPGMQSSGYTEPRAQQPFSGKHFLQALPP